MAGKKISDFFVVVSGPTKQQCDNHTLNATPSSSKQEDIQVTLSKDNLPPYPDLGLLNTESDVVDNNTKRRLLTVRWKDAHQFEFPIR